MRDAETTLAIIQQRGRKGLHLKDLKVPGRRVPPVWKQIMASRRRKTLVVCHHCHVAIHRETLTERLRALIHEGKLTPTGDWALPMRKGQRPGTITVLQGERRKVFEGSPTGEPDDGKPSSPVRRGAAETGLRGYRADRPP